MELENCKLCQYNTCSGYNATDLETNETVPGVYLSRPVWAQHQATYKRWLKTSNAAGNNVLDNNVGELFPQDGVAEAILSATINPARERDPILLRGSEDFLDMPQEPSPGCGGTTDPAVQDEPASMLVSCFPFLFFIIHLM